MAHAADKIDVARVDTARLCPFPERADVSATYRMENVETRQINDPDGVGVECLTNDSAGLVSSIISIAWTATGSALIKLTLSYLLGKIRISFSSRRWLFGLTLTWTPGPSHPPQRNHSPSFESGDLSA